MFSKLVQAAGSHFVFVCPDRFSVFQSSSSCLSWLYFRTCTSLGVGVGVGTLLGNECWNLTLLFCCIYLLKFCIHAILYLSVRLGETTTESVFWARCAVTTRTGTPESPKQLSDGPASLPSPLVSLNTGRVLFCFFKTLQNQCWASWHTP